jgi:hypothetical protein
MMVVWDDLIQRIIEAAGCKGVQSDKIVIEMEVDSCVRLYIRSFLKQESAEVLLDGLQRFFVKDVTVGDDCSVKRVSHDGGRVT